MLAILDKARENKWVQEAKFDDFKRFFDDYHLNRHKLVSRKQGEVKVERSTITKSLDEQAIFKNFLTDLTINCKDSKLTRAIKEKVREFLEPKVYKLIHESQEGKGQKNEEFAKKASSVYIALSGPFNNQSDNENYHDSYLKTFLDKAENSDILTTILANNPPSQVAGGKSEIKLFMEEIQEKCNQVLRAEAAKSMPAKSR